MSFSFKKKDDSNQELFRYLNPTDNDQLSSLKGIDLQELIVLLNNSLLDLRKELLLNSDLTFGLELEFEKIKSFSDIRNGLNNLDLTDYWTLTSDSSLDSGAEIISPVLIDDSDNWMDLKKVCQFVSKHASIEKNSGGHIHLGTHILGNNQKFWLNFIKIWSVYENIFFRFLYGDYLTPRNSIYEYARPISKELYVAYEFFKVMNFTMMELIHFIAESRYQAVNFLNVNMFNQNYCPGNTIEFRCPNGSLNPIIWQNNVNLLAKLLLYCTSDKYNDDLIDRRHSINGEMFNSIIWYDEIFLGQSLELADMVFDNNLDKLYFLKQYLKCFQVSKDKTLYEKSKKLTKI